MIDEWSPMHPTSIHCIRFGGNAITGVLLQAATETKTVLKFTDAL